MSETLLQYLFTSLPFIVVVLLALLAVLGIGLGLVWPRLLVYPYLCIFFWMNSTSYGNLSVFASPGVYSRGSGMLLFPVVLWYVLGAWCCARIAAGFGQGAGSGATTYGAGGGQPIGSTGALPGRSLAEVPGNVASCNLLPWFWGWAVLLAAHTGAAFIAGVPVKDALAPSGFSNIVWMGPLVALMLLAFRTREQALELARFIMLAGLGRALFGLARWAAFGGDPNNVYANMNAIRIRLTFFDINDSLLCMLAFSIAAVQLFQAAQVQRVTLWRVLEWLTLGATAACIVLSYRRSAWFGFMLGFAILMLRFPLRRRVQLALAALPLAGAALAYAALRRLGQTRGGSGLFYDMQSRRFGPESERVLELKLVLGDILAKPFTGIGSWGRYSGYEQISWQANPDGGLFLHSGVLHVALKSGLPGIALLAGTVCAFILTARRALRTLPPELLPLGTAGVAALAFMIPDVLVGTPFPQVRTTQMLAIAMALPYVALAVGASPGMPVRAAQRHMRPYPVPA